MSTFDDALTFVFKWEGGYSNDPNDPGRQTKFGISKASHPELDIANLTLKQASDIYEKDYWGPAYCHVLDPSVALMQFDTAVNMGVHEAIVLLQIASGAYPDGVFGPETLEKATTPPYAPMLNKYHDERKLKYRSLLGWDRYGRGWESRNDACLELALSWLSKGAQV